MWLVPKGAVGKKLQALISKLAAELDRSAFVPHVTLVANIHANEAELEEVKRKIARLASSIKPFMVTLSEYGYKDEEYRSLYLHAVSPELDELYQKAAEYFPQVNDEHFRSMPHLSVLYGNFTSDQKEQIIFDNPVEVGEFKIDTLDLVLTDGAAPSWKLEDKTIIKQ